MNIKGQGHSLILVQGHSDSTVSFFFLRNFLADWSQFFCGASMGWGNESLINGLDHMTKMTAKHIYGKNLKPKGRWPWKLVCSIGYSSATKFIQMMILGWPWPILREGQLWSPMLLYGKKVKQWIFSETIVVYYIKIGRCSQLNKYTKFYEYQRSRSFIDLRPKSLRFNIF